MFPKFVGTQRYGIMNMNIRQAVPPSPPPPKIFFRINAVSKTVTIPTLKVSCKAALGWKPRNSQAAFITCQGLNVNNRRAVTTRNYPHSKENPGSLHNTPLPRLKSHQAGAYRANPHNLCHDGSTSFCCSFHFWRYTPWGPWLPNHPPPHPTISHFGSCFE